LDGVNPPQEDDVARPKLSGVAPRRRRLTPDIVLIAAREVLDAEGVDAFNMRSVATNLGTGAASLYRHVKSKDELLDLIVDDALSAVVVPDPALGWRERLTQLARELRGTLMSRRDLARVAMTSSTVSAHSMRIAEAVLDALAAAGASPNYASLMLDRLSLYVTADAFELALYSARMSVAEASEHWAQVSESYAELDADAYPQLVAHAAALTRPDPDERFEAGFQALLDGIEAEVGRSLRMPADVGDTDRRR
jgi:AcrR family transcriptional regulator